MSDLTQSLLKSLNVATLNLIKLEQYFVDNLSIEFKNKNTFYNEDGTTVKVKNSFHSKKTQISFNEYEIIPGKPLFVKKKVYDEILADKEKERDEKIADLKRLISTIKSTIKNKFEGLAINEELTNIEKQINKQDVFTNYIGESIISVFLFFLTKLLKSFENQKYIEKICADTELYSFISDNNKNKISESIEKITKDNIKTFIKLKTPNITFQYNTENFKIKIGKIKVDEEFEIKTDGSRIRVMTPEILTGVSFDGNRNGNYSQFCIFKISQTSSKFLDFYKNKLVQKRTVRKLINNDDGDGIGSSDGDGDGDGDDSISTVAPIINKLTDSQQKYLNSNSNSVIVTPKNSLIQSSNNSTVLPRTDQLKDPSSQSSNDNSNVALTSNELSKLTNNSSAVSSTNDPLTDSLQTTLPSSNSDPTGASTYYYIFRIFNSESGDWISFPGFVVETGKLVLKKTFEKNTSMFGFGNKSYAKGVGTDQSIDIGNAADFNFDKKMNDVIKTPKKENKYNFNTKDNSQKELIELIELIEKLADPKWYPVFTVFEEKKEESKENEEKKKEEEKNVIEIKGRLFKISDEISANDNCKPIMDIITSAPDVKTNVPDASSVASSDVKPDASSVDKSVADSIEKSLTTALNAAFKPESQSINADSIEKSLTTALNAAFKPESQSINADYIDTSLLKALDNALESKPDTSLIEGLPEKLNDALESKKGGKRDPDRERVYKLPIHKRRTDNYYNYE